MFVFVGLLVGGRYACWVGALHRFYGLAAVWLLLFGGYLVLGLQRLGVGRVGCCFGC